jgi:glycosyltransferase involved in cell wall biosynthesis
MYKKPKIVACIPAFKEEATIARVILSAQKYADYVLVCDDGSPDLTGEIAEKLGALVIKHERNMGKGSAVKSLLNEAYKCGADIVVLLDADGQHDPSEIPMLVKPIEQGRADFVIGSRYLSKRNRVPLYRKIGMKIVDYLLRKTRKTSANDTQCGFRAISRKALEVVSSFDAEGFGVESEMLALAAKNGIKVVEVPINVRYAGLKNTSKRSPLKHGAELISTLFRLVVEERPLMYLGLPGIGLTCVGAVLGLYLLWMFNITRYFSIPVAVLTAGFSIAGLLLVTAAIILHGLNRIKEKIDKFHRVNQ